MVTKEQLDKALDEMNRAEEETKRFHPRNTSQGPIPKFVLSEVATAFDNAREARERYEKLVKEFYGF